MLVNFWDCFKTVFNSYKINYFISRSNFKYEVFKLIKESSLDVRMSDHTFDSYRRTLTDSGYLEWNSGGKYLKKFHIPQNTRISKLRSYIDRKILWIEFFNQKMYLTDEDIHRDKIQK